jgi:hypothetical protein
VPALVALVAVFVPGIIAFMNGAAGGEPSRRAPLPIEEVARKSGCSVSEFDGRDHNPPVSGRFVERTRAEDGSYVGRQQPSLTATIHSLYHGRVLIQYRPDLPQRQVEQLHRLVSSDTDRVLLFANQTGMESPVAATSYLSLMTCPRVDARTLRALRIYRDRRRGFGQAF